MSNCPIFFWKTLTLFFDYFFPLCLSPCVCFFSQIVGQWPFFDLTTFAANSSIDRTSLDSVQNKVDTHRKSCLNLQENLLDYQNGNFIRRPPWKTLFDLLWWPVRSLRQRPAVRAVSAASRRRAARRMARVSLRARGDAVVSVAAAIPASCRYVVAVRRRQPRLDRDRAIRPRCSRLVR